MKIEIISAVNIEITQEDLEQLVMDKIHAHDDKITVDSIEFIKRRSNGGLDTIVKAHYGEVVPKLDTGPERTGAVSESEESASVADIFAEDA